VKFDTLKTIEEEYGEGSSLFILCLMSRYSPMITGHIMKTLSINKVELDRCPVIYKSLDDPDTPIELSSVFLQRYVDNLIFGYTTLTDQDEKLDYINNKLKPLLINVIPSEATAKINTSSYFNLDYFDRINKRDDQYSNSSLYNLLDKIYSAGINDKLHNVFLTSDETRDIIEIVNIYFGDGINTSMFVLDAIYNELVKIEPSSKSHGETVTKFLSSLRNRIKEKFIQSEKYKMIKSSSLKQYLEKKLTVSPKEAQLIESVIRDYVKKKVKPYKSIVKESVINGAVLEKDAKQIVDISHLEWSEETFSRISRLAKLKYVNGWRLPTIQELWTAYKLKVKGFKKVQGKSGYWSSSLSGKDFLMGWYITFSDGYVGECSFTEEFNIRLVRDI